MIIDLPEFIHCEVNLEFVSNKKGFEECYIFAVTCIPSRTPLFTIHTINGAVFSRLPLWAFRQLGSKNSDPVTSELVPWGCVGSKAVAVKHSYLKDYEVETTFGAGRYLMTIDYFDGNFSEDPEQHKTHNIIAMYSGLFAAMPNNYCTFFDKHFINKITDTSHYKRQSVYHLAD
jgi:hypothetical protein